MKTPALRGALVALAFVAMAAAHADGLAGSEWRPIELDGEGIPGNAGMFVRFGSDGRIEGHGGCNRFFGSYSLRGDSIEIGPLGGTQMACEDMVMEREGRLHSVLERARRAIRVRFELTLEDEDAQLIARFAQTDAD